MVRFVHVIIIISFLLVNYSCKNNSNSVKVGFLVHTLNDERWAIERDIIVEYISEQGGAVLFNNAENNERLQYQQALEMIKQGVDVLIISPVNSKSAASIVRMCHTNKVKVIAYDIIIENSDLDLYVSFDNEKIGEQMAQYASTICKKGNYVLFWGDGSMAISHWIKGGQLKVLSPLIEDESVNVVYQSFVEGWSAVNAKMKMKRIIDMYNQDIDVVIASSDGIAQGVIDAYLESGIYDMPIITGQDASLSAIENIKNGYQSMSIEKSFNDLALVAAKNALLMAKNRETSTSRIVNNGRFEVPSVLIETNLYEINN